MGDFVSEKKKVGIVTLHGYFNYGNRLQNYAVEQVLKSLGCEVESIINTTRKSRESDKKNKNTILDKISKISEVGLKELFHKIYNKAWRYKNKKIIEKSRKEKKEKFKKFSNELLNESDYEISLDNIPDGLDEKFDYFITGSDQVWNPLFSDTSEINFLTFASQKKRISLSASFGISKIPTNYVDDYQKWINDMNYISVREFEGAEIVKALTGSNSEVLIDPTMLLNKDHWLKIAKESKAKPYNKYLFTYILGDFSFERRKKIENIADEYNLEIVNLADIKDLNAFASGPKEFIDFINSASVVFTDSYHASIFSIIFRTPFVVFSRDYNNMSMNSRINTLFKKFNLDSRYENNIDFENNLFNIDFDKTDDVLNREQKKAIRFLEESLEIKSD